jgi:hypothetical protein
MLPKAYHKVEVNFLNNALQNILKPSTCYLISHAKIRWQDSFGIGLKQACQIEFIMIISNCVNQTKQKSMHLKLV